MLLQHELPASPPVHVVQEMNKALFIVCHLQLCVGRFYDAENSP